MRFAVVVLAAALTAACANPAKFAPAVETLATATKLAQSAIVDIDVDANKALRVDLIAHAVKDPASVKFPRHECGVDDQDCSVNVEYKGKLYDLTEEQPSFIPNQLRIMAALVEYTNALELLATAPDHAALDKAAEKVSDAVVKIAAIPSPISPVAAFAEPIGRAAAWLVGEAQDMAKMAALRKATASMQSALDESADTLSRSASALYENFVIEKTEKLDAAYKKWEDARPPTLPQLEAYIAAAKELNAAYAGRPSSTFDALKKAHLELNKAVHAPFASRADLVKAIADFAERAKHAAAIAKTFRDAANEQNP